MLDADHDREVQIAPGSAGGDLRRFHLASGRAEALASAGMIISLVHQFSRLSWG
ncbi:MAG TPA: hypothetical protein VGD37_24235 [Kofleriaceae bacterium]